MTANVLFYGYTIIYIIQLLLLDWEFLLLGKGSYIKNSFVKLLRLWFDAVIPSHPFPSFFFSSSFSISFLPFIFLKTNTSPSLPQ